MKQNLLRRCGVVREGGVGTELSLQTSHVSRMCLHVHLHREEGEGEGEGEGEREGKEE